MRIKSLKSGALNESERIQLAALLIKAGYQVVIGRIPNVPANQSYFIEIIEPVTDQKGFSKDENAE